MSAVRCLVYEDDLYHEFCERMRAASQFAIGMALISSGGLALIEDDLRTCLGRGGRGRFLVGIDLPTTPDALDRLAQWRDEYPSALEVRIFESSKRRIFHPKLAIFGSGTTPSAAIVGSGNLTEGGICKNYEASVVVTDAAATQELLAYFDEHFQGGHARRLEEEWLDRYRATFVSRAKAMKVLRRTRERVRKLRAKRVQPKPAPKRIRGHKFAFTGKIEGWPRDAKLYPAVQRLGGEIAARAAGMSFAECLVHGDILGGRQSTQKLETAIEMAIPIISSEDFLRLLEKEKSRRRK